MDLDDIVKKLVPKSNRKKLKRFLKKKNIWKAIRIIFREFGLTLLEHNRGNGGKAHPQLNQAKTGMMNDDDTFLLDKLAQAQRYYEQIAGMAQMTPYGSKEQSRLQQLAEQFNEWVNAIDSLLNRALYQEDDSFLEAERKRIPAAIKRLKKQLKEAKAPAVQEKLTQTLAAREQQLAQLNGTTNQRQLTELRLEKSLARMGTIYSQIRNEQVVTDKFRFNLLMDDIVEEIEYLLGASADPVWLQKGGVP